MNTALSLVRLDPARAEGVLEDLAELFRVALTDTGESVTLAEEVELAQRYLAIEQIRFGDRLQVSWELDAEAGAARVPPLLLLGSNLLTLFLGWELVGLSSYLLINFWHFRHSAVAAGK